MKPDPRPRCRGMAMRLARPWMQGLVFASLGCRPQGGAPPESETCGATPDPAAVVLSFPGSGCPWVLEQREHQLHLRRLDAPPSTLASGRAPTACVGRPCHWRGVDSSLGPLVVAVPVSPQSEMPLGAHLGLAHDHELVFVDVWAGAGETVSDTFTDLGPSHALAAYDCGGRLGLRSEPRVPAGSGQPAPPELREREGIYDPDTGERAAAWPGDGDCERIRMPMP